MKNISCIFAFLLCTGVTWAQAPNCAPPNDRAIHLPPHYARSSESGYDGSFFAPPNVIGQTFTDSLSRCIITQLTHDKAIAARHEYASMSAINKDDSLILLLDQSGVWFVTDLHGSIIVPKGNVPLRGGIGARWDTVNPLVFYYVNGDAKVHKGVIPVNYQDCAPSCKMSSIVLHDFSGQYVDNQGSDGLSLGAGEGDMQLNQPNLIVLCGIETGGTAVGVCQCTSCTLDVFVYNVATDKVGPKLSLNSRVTVPAGPQAGQPVTKEFDNAQLTPDGQVVIDWDAQGLGPCVSGPCYNGFELFDTSMNFVRNLYWPGSSHSKEMYFGGVSYFVAYDGYGYACSQQGLLAENINTGVATCIFNNFLPWNGSIHVGGSEDGSGWVITGHVDYKTAGAASYPLAKNWMLDVLSTGVPSSAGYWGAFTSEVILVRVDGSSSYRMTWSRSRPSGSSYWKIPRSTISRDAKYIVYDSDYGQGVDTPATDYTDVFLIGTGIGESSTMSPAPPSGLTITVSP